LVLWACDLEESYKETDGTLEFSGRESESETEFGEGQGNLIGGIRRDDEGKEGLRSEEIQATASVIIIAGSEITVTILNWTTSYLVKIPTS
jgi:cytochrome P450